MNITKDFFESYLSTTISAEVQVFDKIKPALDRKCELARLNILGDEVSKSIDAAPDSPLASCAMGFVCIDTMLTQLHQLNLVLTPTGFGVVANNTTSPASKARVSSLEKQLLVNREIAFAVLIDALRNTKGWGNTPQAKTVITTPFYSISFVSSFPTEKDYEMWEKMKAIALDADTDIRKLIGGAQMDDIMQKVRNNTSDVVYCDAARIICEIYRMQYWNSPVINDKKRYLLQFMDDNIETFSIYAGSNEYKANHYERFKNKKGGKAFHFCG